MEISKLPKDKIITFMQLAIPKFQGNLGISNLLSRAIFSWW